MKTRERLQQLRLCILVNSYLYYELGISLISDGQFDALSIELVTLNKEYPSLAGEGLFAKEFKDFDGSTGFNLDYKQDWVKKKALKIKDLGNEHKKIQQGAGVKSGQKPTRKKTAKFRSHSLF